MVTILVGFCHFLPFKRSTVRGKHTTLPQKHINYETSDALLQTSMAVLQNKHGCIANKHGCIKKNKNKNPTTRYTALILLPGCNGRGMVRHWLTLVDPVFNLIGLAQNVYFGLLNAVRLTFGPLKHHLCTLLIIFTLTVNELSISKWMLICPPILFILHLFLSHFSPSQPFTAFGRIVRSLSHSHSL